MKKNLIILSAITALFVIIQQNTFSAEPLLNVSVPDVNVETKDNLKMPDVIPTAMKNTKKNAEKETKKIKDKTTESTKGLKDKTVEATKNAAQKTAEKTKKITDKAVDNTMDFIDDLPPAHEVTVESLEKSASIKTLKNERNELKSAYNSRIKDLNAKIKAAESSTLLSDVQRQNRIYTLNKQKQELEQERNTAVEKYNIKIKEIKSKK